MNFRLVLQFHDSNILQMTKDQLYYDRPNRQTMCGISLDFALSSGFFLLPRLKRSSSQMFANICPNLPVVSFETVGLFL